MAITMKTALGMLNPALVTLVLLSSCATQLTEPEELIEEPAGEHAMRIPERAEAERDTLEEPEIMILGSTHFEQIDHGITDDEFETVVASLADYRPEVVAVEYLPPDWPVGEGRDYRPGFDLEEIGEKWDMDRDRVEAIVAEHRDEPWSVEDRCTLGNAYFLLRDYPNAAYHWFGAEGGLESGTASWPLEACERPAAHDGITDWLEDFREHESVRLAAAVAERNDIGELVSYDYQGDDARWTIGLRRFAVGLFPWTAVAESNRLTGAWLEEYQEPLTDHLQFANSPTWIGLQYWSYEENELGIRFGDAGARQTERYWLRNERMFEYLEEAIEEQEPQRVLATVGMGHKCFLDELVLENGYRWVDPRGFLPPSSDPAPDP